MCRIEGQKTMKYVPFAVTVCINNYVKYALPSHAQNTLQPCRQLLKLKIMTVSIKIKVLIKYGASDIICVELRAKEL